MASNSGKGDAMVEDASRVKVQDSRPMWKKCCDIDYVIYTWEGRLKLVEFFTTVLALICVASTGEAINNVSKFEFFIFVATTSWVFIGLHIVLRMTHIYEKLPLILISTLTRAICCAVGVVALLISSAIVVAGTNLGSLLAGGAFGFITMFLFFFEGLYSFKLHRDANAEARRNAPSTTATQEEEFVDPASAPY